MKITGTHQEIDIDGAAEMITNAKRSTLNQNQHSHNTHTHTQ
jgi:hypothetical protein